MNPDPGFLQQTAALIFNTLSVTLVLATVIYPFFMGLEAMQTFQQKMEEEMKKNALPWYPEEKNYQDWGYALKSLSLLIFFTAMICDGAPALVQNFTNIDFNYSISEGLYRAVGNEGAPKILLYLFGGLVFTLLAFMGYYPTPEQNNNDAVKIKHE